MKYKEFINVIKSGSVGAFAFTGIYIILAIASLFTSLWIPLVTYAFLITIPFPKAVFITTGSIGFILGLVLRRRFPIIQRGVLPLIIALVMLVVPLGCWRLLVHKMWMGVEYPPQELKLADCTNNVMNIHLKIPRGHGYQFELLTPGAQTTTPNGSIISSYKFSGRIRILSGTSLVADLPIGPDKVEFIESGSILTGVSSQNTSVSLGQFLQPRKDYDIKITFDPPPPPSSSIWLYWLQSAKDRDR